MLVLLLSAISVAAAAFCPLGYILEPNTAKCYRVSTIPTSFFSAQYSCTEDGGNLASITNGFENSFVASILPSTGYYYIGLTRLVNPNKWTWLDETPLYYTNFYPNQNYNESCVAYSALVDAWFTISCYSNLGYVCSLTPTSTCPTCPVYNGTCAARCETGWTYFAQTRSCYRTLKDANWYTGEENCQAAGGHLVSIHNQAENDFVMEISKTGVNGADNTMPYIGLSRQSNGAWAWTDGTAVNYTRWQTRAPFDTPYDCTYLYSDGTAAYLSYWYTTKCTDIQRAFVCKKPAL